MKKFFKLIGSLALASCSSNIYNNGSSSPIQLNKPALKSNSEIISSYDVIASSKSESKRSNPSFALSGGEELTATVQVNVNGILNVSTITSSSTNVGNGDLNLGTMALSIQYNGINETMVGRQYEGKTFKMYAYSEGLIGKLRDSDCVGIKLTATNNSADANSAPITLVNNSIILSNSRNLGKIEPYNNVSPVVLVASWDVSPNNVQYIKNTINLSITGLFGSPEVPKSAQDYLGNISFYFVAEDSESLATGNVLQAQIDYFSSNNRLYVVNESNSPNLPYSLKIIADNSSISNQVKITAKASSSSQNFEIIGRIKSGIIVAIYNSKKIFIKKSGANLTIVNSENETEFRNYK